MSPMNMPKQAAQAGFTLIELMIVVAILGILAVAAIPVYSNYTLKAKVSEAAALSAPARLALAQAFNEGTLSSTTTNETLGLASATGRYATAVTAVGTSATAGTVSVTMAATNSSDVDGKKLVYLISCTAGAQCMTSYDASADVPEKYRPKL